MNKIEQVRGKLEQLQMDGLLITNSFNRSYLSGFTGTSGVVLITKDRALFITDFRYTEQAQKQCVGYEIVQQTGSLVEEVAKQVAHLSIRYLGFEETNVTYKEFKEYENALSATLVPVSNVIENLRLIKTPQEINILKDAAKIADAAFAHILTVLKPGMTELEVSNELEFFMRKQGATSSSFDIIVASGERSALPHGVATHKKIEKGDMVTLDFGALYNGYISDITRTVAVGNPKDELKEIYQVVLEAQLKGVEGIKAGITGIQADALTRDHIASCGYGQYFGHSTGHGIGLEVHEGPGLSAKSSTILVPNMVVTCEPGIYVAGLGGVRIEDDLIITETGNEVITFSPKELIIL